MHDNNAAPLVAITTLPLQNFNYGGILQAYALSEVLRSFGLGPHLHQHRYSFNETLSRVIKTFLKTTMVRLFPPSAVPQRWLEKHLEPEICKALNDFIDNKFDYLDATNTTENPVAFITGSDQVWRREYSDVKTYLFDFLPEKDERPRISYAASFGRSDLQEYETSLLKETAALASRLDTISVRERSGVSLVEQYWGRSAEQHVDPTLLLPKEHYLALAKSAPPAHALPAHSYLLDYVLDERPEVRRQAQLVGEALDIESFSLMPPIPSSLGQYRGNRETYKRLSIEEWLASIAQADFVITDSFHGTVFSLIFNKPFVAVVNSERGASRFKDLLEQFNLQDRCIAPGAHISSKLLSKSIDWHTVNSNIVIERKRSLSFLQKALSPVIAMHSGPMPGE